MAADQRGSSLIRRKREESVRCMHVLDSIGEQTRILTKATWNTFRLIAKEWLDIGGNEANAVRNVTGLLECQYKELGSPLPQYHPSCYKRFTDKCQLFYAKKQKQKTHGSVEKPHQSIDGKQTVMPTY